MYWHHTPLHISHIIYHKAADVSMFLCISICTDDGDLHLVSRLATFLLNFSSSIIVLNIKLKYTAS